MILKIFLINFPLNLKLFGNRMKDLFFVIMKKPDNETYEEVFTIMKDVLKGMYLLVNILVSLVSPSTIDVMHERKATNMNACG